MPASAVVLAGAGGLALVPQGDAALASPPPTIADVHALLADRSPGARADGALYQTKLALLRDPLPHERVLAPVRSRAASPAGAVPPLAGAAPPEEGALPPDNAGPSFVGDAGEAGPTGGASFPDGFVGFPGGDGGVLPIGGGGGGGGDTVATPTPTPTTTPPTVAAVPEPATWLSMILGLLMAGSLLRRRERRPLFARA